MKTCLGATAAIAVLAAVGVNVAFQRMRAARIPPPHLQGHPLIYERGLIPPELGEALLARVQQLSDFPTNVNDLTFYKTRHEHIGEAIPSVNGSCAHPFLTPSSDRSLCVLPGRIDVGRAYVLSGGLEGLKESHATLVSRVQSFGRYHFMADPSSVFPEASQLFDLPQFRRLAAAVCPPHAQVLDPFQFNFIAQVPGQTVAAHTDAPYFWGADRFTVPQWLLAVMVASNLFSQQFIDQVQVVAYIHRWHDDNHSKAGEFAYWADGSGVPAYVPAEPLSGSAVDGSKVVHAAAVFQPGVRPPVLDKSKRNMLHFAPAASSSGSGGVQDGSWLLLSDEEEVQRYATDELRFSVVYRARCFESEAAKHAYAGQDRGNATHTGDMMPLEDILETLSEDMVLRRVVSDRRELSRLSRLDLALKLLDTYIKYPLSHTAAVPVNYCALKLVLPPALAWPLDYVC